MKKLRLQPTLEQADIVKSCPAPGEIMLINAYAGTGKTSTLKMIAETNSDKRILYLCYNRLTAEKAAKSFPKNTKCRTIHSMAFAEIGRHYEHKLGTPTTREAMALLNTDKSYIAVLALRLVEAYCHSTETEISLAVLNPEQDRDLYFGVASYPECVPLAKILWDEMTSLSSDFKISHDGYLKLWGLKKPVLLYQLILIDEAQDTNPITHEVVLSQAKSKRSGLIFVGDTHQAIYSWRGAVNTMALLKDEARRTHPLTTSFRFGQEIANNASKILGYLDDPVRLIGAGPTKNTLPAKAVIGRRNGTLIYHAAVAMLKEHQRVHFAGTSAQDDWDPYFLYEFQILLDLHYLSSGNPELVETPQIKAFKDYEQVLDQVKGDGNSVGGDENLYAWVKLLEYLGETAVSVGKTVPQLVEYFRDNSTSPEEADISVSTAHRAKGLEWKSVSLLGDFSNIAPRYKAIQPNENDRLSTLGREQVNLIYVAATRGANSVEYYDTLIEWFSRREIGQTFELRPPADQETTIL